MRRPTLVGQLLTAWAFAAVGGSGWSARGSTQGATAEQSHSGGLGGARGALPVAEAPAGFSPLTLLASLHGAHAAFASSRSRANRMNVSGSVSCAELGISYLSRVPLAERHPLTSYRAHGHGASWPRGHYPWPVCANASLRPPPASPVPAPAGLPGPVDAPPPAAPRPPLTVLMVADSTYSVRIPAWALLVRSFGAACAVGDVGDASDVAPRQPGRHAPVAQPAACAAADAAGCECFSPPSRAEAGSRRSDADGALALAVRWRFKYALTLLRRGHEVLMHDADVFFSPAGMRATLRVAAAERSSAGGGSPAPRASRGLGAHFVLQPNGRRREAFDDLNWGFVWISASRAAENVLQCALDTWNHLAFRGPPLPARSWYYVRSQPRLNHILEAAIASAPWPAAEPRACTLPRRLFFRWGSKDRPMLLGMSVGEEQSVVHFTGFETPQRKLLCAKTEGLLLPAPETAQLAPARDGSAPSPVIRRVLSYSPPLGAPAAAQGRALAAAYALAETLDAEVGLPPAALMVRGAAANAEHGVNTTRAERENASKAEPATAGHRGAAPAAPGTTEYAPGTTEYVPLCRLVDVESLPMQRSVASPLAPDGRPACSHGARTVAASDLAGRDAVHSSASAIYSSASPGMAWHGAAGVALPREASQGVVGVAVWCVDFGSLLHYANATGGHAGIPPLFTCDHPWHPSVTSSHSCIASKYSRETGATSAPGDSRPAEATRAHRGDKRGARGWWHPSREGGVHPAATASHAK